MSTELESEVAALQLGETDNDKENSITQIEAMNEDVESDEEKSNPLESKQAHTAAIAKYSEAALIVSSTPRTLYKEPFHEDPRMYFVKNFLTDLECDVIIALTQGNFTPCHTGSATQGDMYEAMKEGNGFKCLDVKVSTTRTGMVCLLEPYMHPIVQLVMERVALLAECDYEQVECLSVVRYYPGQFFKEHHDGAFRPKTVFMYLNDVPEGDGGETRFPYLGYKISPHKGMAAMWPNILENGKADAKMIHEGLPTQKTIKYGINCFINKDKIQKKLVAVNAESLKLPR